MSNDSIFSEPLNEDSHDIADDDAVVDYTDTPNETNDYAEETSGLSEAEIAAGITLADYADAAPFLTDGNDSLPREQRIFAAVELTYGPRWQRPLSRNQKYTQGHLGAIRAGHRALTVEVQREVLPACLAQIRRDEERLARAKAAIIRALGQ